MPFKRNVFRQVVPFARDVFRQVMPCTQDVFRQVMPFTKNISYSKMPHARTSHGRLYAGESIEERINRKKDVWRELQGCLDKAGEVLQMLIPPPKRLAPTQVPHTHVARATS